MTVGLGEWASASASEASLRFHKDRARVLDEATPRSASRLAEGMGRFREVEQRQQPQMPGLGGDIFPVPGDPSFEPPQEMPLGRGTYLQPGETQPPLTAAESRYFGVPEPTEEPPFRESTIGLIQLRADELMRPGEHRISDYPPEAKQLVVERQELGSFWPTPYISGESLTPDLAWGIAAREHELHTLEQAGVEQPLMGMKPGMAGLAGTAARGTLALPISPLLPPEVTEKIGEIPVVGPAAEREAEFLSSPVGLAATAAFPAFTALGSVGGVAAGTTAQELGASEAKQLYAQIAGNVLAPGAGLVPSGVVTRPARAGLRGARGLTEEAIGRARLAPEAGGPRVPGAGLRRPTPEGMRLTNDIPAIGEIRSRLIEIDTELAKPRIKGGRPALLTERAKLQAQADIDEVLASGRPVEEQFGVLEVELGEIRVELQTRTLPFRGRYRYGGAQAPQFGPEFKEWQRGRPSAARRDEALAARTAERYPGVATNELNARERVYAEFIGNARFEPVPADELVGRARFTPEGEVVREPTYATEGELAGVRAQQGELGIGAGERPVETAGPLFRQGDEVVSGVGVQPEVGKATQPPSAPPSPPADAAVESRIEASVSGRGVPPGEPPTVGLADAVAQPPPEGVGFAAELRPLREIMDEVIGRDDIAARIASRLGINKSVEAMTPVEKAIIAYHRQEIAIEELVKVARAASWDVHQIPFAGLPRFRIATDTTIRGLRAKPGQSRSWMDVFSRPQEYEGLASTQRAAIADYVRVPQEMEAMRVAHGLKPRAMNKDGWFYVPRQVKTTKGVELRRPSDPSLQRLYEEAQEGVARGVKYSIDPGANLELHVRQAYREIALAELSAELAPHSVTPSALLRATRPAIVSRMEQAANRFMRAGREMRRLVVPRVEKVGRVAPEEKALRATLTRQRQAAKAELLAARAEFQAAKGPYRRAMEAARKAEVGPGELFGRAEENIAIGQWRSRFFPLEERDFLTEGLRRQGADPGLFAKTFQTLGNYKRFLGAIGDFALPGIQGQPVLAENPSAWARGSLRHYQAWFDPVVQARHIRMNLEDYQWMARHAVPVGDPEFFAALRPGEGVSLGAFLEQLPKGPEVRQLLRFAGRQTFGRFQASYNMGLGAYRQMTLGGLRHGWRGTDAELAAHIRNLTGGLDSRALGIGPTQRGIESMWLAFAPRLLRSTVALGAAMRNPLTPQGQAAWRVVGRYIVGVHGLFVLSSLALGKDWDYILRGLNPLSGGKYLSHNVGDAWIGPGGQIRALSQILVHATATIGRGTVALARGEPGEAGEEFGAFVRLDLDNPLLRGWLYRGAVGPSLIGPPVEAATGEDVVPFEEIDSLPDVLQHIGQESLPFATQSYMEGVGWTGFGAEWTAGARAYPISLRDAFEMETGLKWEETPRFRRDELIRDSPRLRALAEARPPTGAEEIREERSAELLPLAQPVLQGTPGAARNYSDNRPTIMARFAGASQEAFKDLDFEPKGEDNKLLEQYYAVEFLEDRNLDGIPGDDDDVRLALEERDGIFKQLSPDVQKAMENPANFFPGEEVVEVERRRDQAVDAIRHLIDEIPKYQGATVEQGKEADDYARYVRQRWTDAKREAGGGEIISQAEAAKRLGEAEGRPDLGTDAAAIISQRATYNEDYNDYLVKNQRTIAPWFSGFYKRALFREPEVLEDDIWQEVNVPIPSPARPSSRETLPAKTLAALRS